MKAVRLKAGSWHHKLAKFGGMSRHDTATNLCEYMSHVLWGGFFAAGLAVLLSLGLYGTGAMLAAIVVLFQTGMWLPGYAFEFTDNLVLFVSTIYSIKLAIGVWVGVSWLRNQYRIYVYNKWFATIGVRSQQPKPSFIQLAWQSFKDKTCVRVAIDE